MIALTVSTLLFAASPSLLFSPADLSMLRERCGQAEHAAIYANVCAQADAMCTPGSEGFADPALAGMGGEQRPEKLRGNFYGSRMRNWMETLGFAYAMTGEQRYADKAIALLLASTDALPPDTPPMGPSYMDGRGNLMRGIAFGFDFFRDAMRPEQRKTIAEWAASYCRSFYVETTQTRPWWMPYHNYSGIGGSGSGLLALALRDDFPHESKQWLENSRSVVVNWFDLGFDIEGAYCEGTSYAEYALGGTVVFLHALRRATGEDLFRHPNLKRVPEFFAMSLLPGERVFDARNDAYYKPMSDPFMLGIAYGARNGLAKWLWENAADKQDNWLRILWDTDLASLSPAEAIPKRVHFYPGRGLLIARTGWNADDTMFSIEAGPFHRKTHNQADKGHFTLYGPGGRWAIDSGYGNTQDPNGTAQTVAHNCVLIDGEGQALSGAGLGTFGRVLSARIDTNPAIITLDCTDAYLRNSDGHENIAIQRAIRTAVVVWPEDELPMYFVIFDSIQMDADSHAFTWLLHADRSNRVRLNEAEAQIVNDATGASLYVSISASAPVRAELDTYADHPRLSFTAVAINPAFAAVLIPLKEGDPPTVSFGRSDLGTTVKIAWKRMLDTIEFSDRERRSGSGVAWKRSDCPNPRHSATAAWLTTNEVAHSNVN
jgi:hypothetical protein